ncbi:Bacterial regulatory proteins, tetR family [Roseivivax jejudonensis]|uniref:Bacterial regulatory proteins, tetR family n=1 Tax=Roseivivax jejudonensis TaxID=1529041 RepID=A0A1X6Z8J7_9RHOB|nr:TetR/AcrR family transcriptional regulator [Roseivivax jejudonensis]SLN43950.1 Bacterial regulatory proteins, tetR family [Roseivivax jejudonensis]
MGEGGTRDAAGAAAGAAGWRGSRALWLDTARAAFVESGLDAVKIQPLAARLGLSRTSFYWFFRDRAALLDALLETWEAQNTGRLAAACNAYAATAPEAMLNLIGAFLDPDGFDPGLDLAVRGWAHRSAAVTERVNAADIERLRAIRALFERWGFTGAEADTRARTAYLVQIGYIALQTDETLATRLERVPSYVKVYCGEAPSEADLARFRARFGAAG